ncbi:RnfABCDGE type electron transport complex subunit G [Rhodoferax sp. 4810]|nr:RnfABCDGE type electron transport complex subunit G [Rhodoferax jenense]
MLLALGLVAAICGLIIVVAYEGSLSSVKENRRVAMERAIHKVLPGAAKTVAYVALPNGSVSPAADAADAANGVPFHAAFDAAGQLMGIAAEGSAKGYAGNVRIMFGYSPQCNCVVGFSVVSMQETPGIGDKILKDASFLANFKALDVRLAADMKALANEVKTVKHGTKTQAWQIDAISGATVTSRAVGRAINDAAQALLPVLVPQIEKIGSSK